MNMKKTLLFILIVAIVAFAGYTAIYGIEIGGKKITKVQDSIDLGLDLAGGVYVVLEAQTDLQGVELQKAMERTKMIINQRVDGLGVAEPNITIEGNNRIRVELAGVKNPQDAIEIIGKTAQLQFIDAKGNEVLSGKNVKSSDVVFSQDEYGNDRPVVSLEFDKDGAVAFKEATERAMAESETLDRVIYIVLDDEIISAPVVESVISEGKAVIQGQFDVEGANALATLISAGALPVDMAELQTSVIGPTLGLEALERSIKAGEIAILIIFLFMLVYYRIPGLVADIGLTIYILIVLYSMRFLGVKLTLPGIAGLILSIGMAVDANVLIFERIKEELRNGRSIRAAIDQGFQRALTSVLDSNITTLIAGVVLYYFGIGPIKGFGVTLILGIIASMITSVFITKHLLKLTVDITNTKNTKLYGA
ncbi:MAG: protein translocase subunit SecD [Tissierellia bacterium]|nr:protein translocase subunit SecD [Tissierellia bacterium]